VIFNVVEASYANRYSEKTMISINCHYLRLNLKIFQVGSMKSLEIEDIYPNSIDIICRK